jgi:hypothetical protein
LVKNLFRVCREHSFRLDWQAGHCRVHWLGRNGEEVIDFPLRKSVFRAILARVAVLCNKHTPNSVSPYGGQGELLVDANPLAVCKATFVNTPAEQKLELMAAATSIPGNSHSGSEKAS